jgi:hypothetical protein
MKNLSINEYKDIIKFYKKTMPKTIFKVKKKGQMLLYNMVQTNITDQKMLFMKMNRRKNINRTLKYKRSIDL